MPLVAEDSTATQPGRRLRSGRRSSDLQLPALGTPGFIRSQSGQPSDTSFSSLITSRRRGGTAQDPGYCRHATNVTGVFPREREN
jgi:hypothetical protein